MDKHSRLEDQRLELEVFQELSSSETLQIGKLRLNLAEYANGEGRGREDDVVVRRYLMQDSKINSTVKIGIGMHQLDGPTDFIAPPLRAAAVFEGFTGIIASEQEQDGMSGQNTSGKTPTGPSAELNELQDMYRLALAASWACGGSGELAADKCVEDIFAGGDGWGNKAQPARDTYNQTLHPDARRGSLRTWTNDESEDEGMGTATPANRESWASRTRRRIHTPRGTRTRGGEDTDGHPSSSRTEDRSDARSLQDERNDQRSLRERSLRYEAREKERERSLRNEDRVSSARSLFDTRSIRSKSDQRSTRFDLSQDDGDKTTPSRTASEHSRASGFSHHSLQSEKPSKASSIRTTSSASLSTSETIPPNTLRTRGQQATGSVYDPINPLSKIHYPDASPSLVPGDMTTMRAMRAPRSPQSVRFPTPKPRPASPKSGSYPGNGRLGPHSADEREPHTFDRERHGSAGSWGGKSRRREEVLEWDVREDLRAWKVPAKESSLEDAGTGPGAVKGKSEKGGAECEEDKKKTSVVAGDGKDGENKEGLMDDAENEGGGRVDGGRDGKEAVEREWKM